MKLNSCEYITLNSKSKLKIMVQTTLIILLLSFSNALSNLKISKLKVDSDYLNIDNQLKGSFDNNESENDSLPIKENQDHVNKDNKSTNTTIKKSSRIKRKQEERQQSSSLKNNESHPQEIPVISPIFENYIKQHVIHLKSENTNFIDMKTKYVNTRSATNINKEDNLEQLWNSNEVIETESERYMYSLISKMYNVQIADFTPNPITKENKKTLTLKEQFEKYFIRSDRPYCNVNPNLKFNKTPIVPEIKEDLVLLNPTAKPNLNYLFYGFEDSAYLFDYLDLIFQKKISYTFKIFWEQVRLLPPKIGIFDPYTPYLQLKHYYNTQDQNSNVRIEMPKETDSDEDLIKLLAKIKPNFQPQDYRLGISIPKLALVYEKFRWPYSIGDPSYFKLVFDKYDFDGDGRLDAREFLFLTIWQNRDLMHSNSLLNPFNKLIKELIDPIFEYTDCTGSNYIESSQIWNSLRELKRSSVLSDNEHFNIFNCELINFRTNSVNDFVLKNSRENKGFLNKDEFTSGILLGYWDRQTRNNEIFLENEKNLKMTRWKEKKIDIKCEEINFYVNKSLHR